MMEVDEEVFQKCFVMYQRSGKAIDEIISRLDTLTPKVKVVN